VNFPVKFYHVHAHLIFEVLAYFIAFRYYQWLRRNSKDLISDENRLWIFLAASVGGLIGSRFLAFFENSSNLSDFSWMILLGSKTILGGFLGGLFAVEGIKKVQGIKTSSGDLMTYPIILGLCLGRIGCFLEGLEDGTFGLATNLPWGIDFGDGISRHPTQLYEIIFLILVSFSIFLSEKRFKFRNGDRFKVFLFSYFVFRFFIEFIKPIDSYILRLGAIQIGALLGIIYYLVLMITKRNEKQLEKE
jgi:prolipoprotein diacylglyceryltransferase